MRERAMLIGASIRIERNEPTGTAVVLRLPRETDDAHRDED
jgi:signal transduction histidine kinase